MTSAEHLTVPGDQTLLAEMLALGQAARRASGVLAQASTEDKNAALRRMADEISNRKDDILEANRADVANARRREIGSALLDRLILNEDRIAAMSRGILDIAELPDPVGQVLADWTRPNGLRIERIRVPLGVIGIIYESRPNVTADAGALCLKAGNAVILRGGSESVQSSRAIHRCLTLGLEATGLPATAIQMVPTTDRAAVGILLKDMEQYVDVIVPRGGKGLIARVQEDARVPVLAHLEGLCHVYIDADADIEKAVAITLNAKMRRTGICGAAETLLVDRAALTSHLKPIIDALIEANCEVRGDPEVCALDSRIRRASSEDWTTEYLDAIIAVKTVEGVEGAVAHIAEFGSRHTDSIVTENADTAEYFLSHVDSAIVMHNASTQFADGGEFGMGAEIGISTGRLHSPGPVGAEQLTTFKYVVRGTGQVRP